MFQTQVILGGLKSTRHGEFSVELDRKTSFATGVGRDFTLLFNESKDELR